MHQHEIDELMKIKQKYIQLMNKQKISSKVYYQKNKAAIKKKQREYYQKNKIRYQEKYIRNKEVLQVKYQLKKVQSK